jgi:O-antigen/teichoic acid export membrane protein
MKIFNLNVSTNYLVNLITTFLSQACSAVLIIVLTPVLQENFSVEEFSNYGVLLNIILFSSAFDFGLNLGLLRRLIHKPERVSVLISSTFVLYLILFFIAIPVFYALYFNGTLQTGSSFFYHAFLTSLLVVQTIVAMLFDVIIQTANKIFVGKLIRISKLIIEFVVLFFLSQKGSAALLLLASSVINFFYILALFSFSKKEVQYDISLAQFKLRELLDHFRYSFWYFLNAIGVVLVFNSQIILLNEVMSKTDVAKYILVSRFLDVVRLGTTNFTTILFPSLALTEARGEWDVLKKMYFLVLKRILLLSLITLILLLTVGELVFQYWSGQSDYDILTLYKILSVFTMLIVIDNVSSVFLHALRLNKIQTIISIGQGVLALLLGYFFLRTMGIIGMAIGSIIALLATNFIYNPAFLISRFKKNVTQKVHLHQDP